jgi:hypothetical protein
MDVLTPSRSRMFQGLRSVIYPTTNLVADKTWWIDLLGIEPYFDEEFYVGFNVGGYELGLDPNASTEGDATSTVYWGVMRSKLPWHGLARAVQCCMAKSETLGMASGWQW